MSLHTDVIIQSCKLAKGYRGSKSKLFKKANEIVVMKALLMQDVTVVPRNANSAICGLLVLMPQPKQRHAGAIAVSCSVWPELKLVLK